MSRDFAVAAQEAGDGLLTRDELKTYIQMLGAERQDAVDSREPVDILDMRLQESNRLLRDMDLVQADAVSYLPERLAALPERLRRRATEVLMFDDEFGLGEIDRGMINAARDRYLDMNSPSLAALNSRNNALAELEELSRALDLI